MKGTYNYNCKNCGNMALELRMSEVPLKECPKCGSEEVVRNYGATNNIWKTDGAYSKRNHKNT
jgi:putative FmdB family regulatory protein